MSALLHGDEVARLNASRFIGLYDKGGCEKGLLVAAEFGRGAVGLLNAIRGRVSGQFRCTACDVIYDLDSAGEFAQRLATGDIGSPQEVGVRGRGDAPSDSRGREGEADELAVPPEVAALLASRDPNEVMRALLHANEAVRLSASCRVGLYDNRGCKKGVLVATEFGLGTVTVLNAVRGRLSGQFRCTSCDVVYNLDSAGEFAQRLATGDIGSPPRQGTAGYDGVIVARDRLRALSQLSAPAPDIARLIDVVKAEGHWATRVKALLRLAELRAIEALPVICEFIGNVDPSFYSEALNALEFYGEEALPVVSEWEVRLPDSDHPSVWDKARERVGESVGKTLEERGYGTSIVIKD